MKIYHISDTHTYHDLLEIPEGIDMIIVSGDCSNPRSPYLNEPEIRDFINWLRGLPIKYKIYVAGNHDSSIAEKLIIRQDFTDRNIIYLENDGIYIEGINIWGSPYSPSFGNWYFMKDRSKLHKLWEQIPEDTDILITHTPPKGVLDLSENREGILEMCGCSALQKKVRKLPNLKLHCFGHIHNTREIINAGTMKWSDRDIIFSNGSVVTDGRFGKLSSNGNIIEI